MAIASGTWMPISQAGLNQAIADTSTTQMYPTGTRVKCKDVGTTQYGEAEFVYAKGVASTIVGSLAILDLVTNTTLTTTRSKGPVGVAMSANVASQWGWYQVTGLAVVATVTTGGAPAPVYLHATAGKVDAAVVAGDVVGGAEFGSAIDTGFSKVSLNNPHTMDTDNA